jgi:phosphohistidine phosphatase
MPTLYLLRHAKSDWGAGETDHERPLNPRGRKAAVRLGEHLDALGAHPERVLCSSARRALETWAGLTTAWALDPECLTVSDRLYLASGSELLELLREQPSDVEAVLVIAHNPGIHDLALALAGEGDRDAYERLREKLPTGGLCELSFAEPWSALRPGAGRLVRFEVPRRLG